MGSLFSCCCSCLPDSLRLRCLKKDKKYGFPFKTYTVFVQEVIDGDTFHITFFIDKTPVTLKLRLFGVDTPELSSKNLVEKQAAVKVRNIIERKILHRYLTCELHKWDKYGGRVVGKIFVNGKSLTDTILKYKLGKAYEGASKEDWKEEELQSMLNCCYEKIRW